MKRTVVFFFVAVIFAFTLSVSLKVQTAEASPGTIYIRADGSVDPPAAPISTLDKVLYSLSSTISDSIVVERDNIIIDGNGQKLQVLSGTGIYLTGRTNVTVRNTEIRNCDYGIYLLNSTNNNLSGNNIMNGNGYGIYVHYSSHNNIIGNNFTNDIQGIGLLSSFNNTVNGNYIASHEIGFSLSLSSYNDIVNNTFTYAGLVVYGSHLNTVEGNTVNGKPLAYLENMAGFNVTDAGQVILVSCSNIRVENLNLSWTSIGVQLCETHGTTISRNDLSNDTMGIALYDSFLNTVHQNNITGKGILVYNSSNNSFSQNSIVDGGIQTYDSSSNAITGNVIRGDTGFGINLWGDNNNVSDNSVEITGNIQQAGIEIVGKYCNISNNIITSENGWGIRLDGSDNKLKGNNMVNNSFNFGLPTEYADPSKLVNDVDTTNLVDNKPVYYWINKTELTVPLDAGYVALINCARITVESLSLLKNSQGILLAFTNDSIVTQNVIMNNWNGIELLSSSHDNITHNNVTGNLYNVWLHNSSGNSLSINRVTNAWDNGIRLVGCSNNQLYGNTIANNPTGLLLSDSWNNTVYNNNFVNNTGQVWSYELDNKWDSGYPVGGNYWSDYEGVDLQSGPNQDEPGNDGIGDTAYIAQVNNTDHYPLMGPFSDFNATQDHRVQILTNSTLFDFHFNGTAIFFKVAGDNETFGFCRICIPTDLMSSPYSIYVNGTEVTYKLLSPSNETCNYLYFNYSHPTEQVIIIPEFPSSLILPILMLGTLPVVTVCRKKWTSKID